MEANPHLSARRIGSLVCAALFLATIYAPLVDQVLRPAEARDSSHEFRVPAPRPRLALDAPALSAFPKAFEAWYDDSFGLRDRFLRWHNMARWYALGSSPSERIVLGEDGWIFTRSNSSLEDHRGMVPMSEGELEQWRAFLERRRDWLAQRGIAYLLAVAPNKNQVYPERLPPRFAPAVGPTRLDQLGAWLAERSDVPLLDLRSVLRAERRYDRGADFTYFPLGTHWTERGAYAGYCATIAALGCTECVGKPLGRCEFEVAPRDDDGDSWGGRLYMGDLLRQANLGWDVREPRACLVEGGLEDTRARFEQEDREGLPRALFLHDSFGLPMRPWLAEHFGELECLWSTGLDAEQIDRERPDAVIQLYSEHTLISFVPQLTPFEDEGATAARFAACDEVLWSFAGAPAEAGLDSESELALEQGSLRIQRQRPDELLYLPALPYPRDRTLLLCVEVDSEQSGPLQVFFQTKDQPSYHRNRTLQGLMERGRSEVYFVLPPLGVAGRLAVRIGSGAGTYRVSRIEVRVAVG